MLLTGHQASIPHGERAKALIDHDIAVSQPSRLLLDPERLQAPADELVGEALLAVGEPRPRLAATSWDVRSL
ncbi:MAG: hypothetical protein AB7U83_01795 [Vicinamibacterales bacterium]